MSNPSQKKNSFFGGAAILTASIIVVKLIGALFKIPLGNIISEAAFADFNTAYYIYSLLIIISTGGLPVALSKMVSEANALGRGNQIRKVFRVAMAAFCTMGIITMLVMLLFPRQLADLMNNSHSYYCILALAPALFFICPLSALRGYFQGHSLMTPTAVSQIIEAACKLVFGLSLSAYMVSRNMEESITASGAIIGVTIGSALAMFYVMFCHHRHASRLPRFHDTPDSTRSILSTLLKLAVPITLGASAMALANLLDTSIIFGRLQSGAGFSEMESRILKGIYDKALTLYNLPSAFMIPLTASVIPAVSAARAVKNYDEGARISETALRTTALFAFPAGIGLSALSTPIIRLLYPGTNVELAGGMLRTLGIASIFVCIMLICNSILQAHRLVTIPMTTTIVGCVFKIIVIYILAGIPSINIKGGPVSTVTCFGIIALLDLIIIKRSLPRSLSYVRAFLKPGLSALLMGAAAAAVYGLSSAMLLKADAFRTLAADGQAFMLTRTGNALATMAAIGVGVIVYAALILLTRAISKDDLALMPKGDKIAKLLHIR
ncbi:MAG: polysaccharide biosynthesis protein [Oscillospiraceae bacterium]|nr:polysaccharide biosynthesis protein [Oscillospiraceae bacterium]